MKINTLSALGLGAMLAAAAATAAAQTEGSVKPTYQIPTSTNEAKDGPRGIPLSEGLSLFPSVSTSLGRDDNLFITNTNRTSTTFFRVNPNLLLEARGESNIFKLSYDGDITRYSSSSADNYVDSRFNGSGEFVFSRSVGLRLAGQYNKLHDPRGSTDRGVSNVADKYTNSGGGFLLAYGANDAFGRIEVEANTYRKRYDNNRTTTLASD
ncbi:MAG: outer membrane beta-barrel protein, partial [Betaproteobacteria bacterium]|nr:outer membrane beta-barrel protein [Betaproteobacteria bacterium]